MCLGTVHLTFTDRGTVKLQIPGFVTILRALQHFRQLRSWKILIDSLRENFQTQIVIGHRAYLTLNQRQRSYR
jgi:hypothetical protein